MARILSICLVLLLASGRNSLAAQTAVCRLADDLDLPDHRACLMGCSKNASRPAAAYLRTRRWH